jgi:hypothetical protein
MTPPAKFTHSRTNSQSQIRFRHAIIRDVPWFMQPAVLAKFYPKWDGDNSTICHFFVKFHQKGLP